MLKRQVRFLKWVGLTGAALLFTTGCPEDAVNIVENAATSLDFAVAPLAPLNVAGGSFSVDRFQLVVFDTTVSDAFGRSVAGNGSFYSSTGSQFGGAYNITNFLRNSSNDGRNPALTEGDVTLGAAPDGMVILDDSGLGFGGGFHNIFNDSPLTNLQPNTEYVVALFRYGVTINGELDGNFRAQGLAADAADDLVAVDGAPAGDPTVSIEAFPTFVNFVGNANPFVLGNFTTDGNGNGFFDVVIDGTGTLYEDDTGSPPDAAFDSSLVGRNDDTATDLPRYNYLVILEGPAADAADAADNPQAVRFQLAQDFEAGTEAPINNGYAPYPEPLTEPELVNAPGGSGRPDSVTVEFFNTEQLADGAVWQVWLLNRDESPITIAPATATYERVAIVREIDPLTGEVLSEEDSVLETVQSVSSFPGQLADEVDGTEQEVKHRVTITSATMGGGMDAPGFFTDIFLTQESSSGAASPSGSSAIWFQYTDQNGTPADFTDDASAGGSLAFGHIDTSDPTAVEMFEAGDFVQSSGLGGVLHENGTITAVSVDVRNLPLPPEGFFYEGWLTNPTTGATMSLGPVTTLPPDTVSLFDADVDQSLPGVTSTGIRFANAFLPLDDPAAIVSTAGGDTTVNLTNFFLTLEPKLGSDGKNATDLETGSLPAAAMIERLRGQ